MADAYMVKDTITYSDGSETVINYTENPIEVVEPVVVTDDVEAETPAAPDVTSVEPASEITPEAAEPVEPVEPEQA